MDYDFAYSQGFRDIEEVVLTVLARYNGANYRIEVLKDCKNDQSPFCTRTYVEGVDKVKEESIWKQCFASYDGCQEESWALQWAFKEIREHEQSHAVR